ncbi:MAG: tetratricopeptide repeat protein [Verrucomicrobiia bacterium]
MSQKSLPGQMPPVWRGGLIVLLVFLAYLPALHCGFIWDDDSYVTENLTLHDLGGLQRIWFQVGAVPQYYPMVHTSFWLEYHLWGLNPVGFHAINVLLHATAAILLWQVLRRLQIPGAWLAAILFALHPVEVESVAWVTERKNVLSAVFYFAAALCYLRFVEWGKTGAPNRLRWSWYGAALALFLAALLSKTVACSLPAALLLVCWWKKGRLQRGDVVPLLPFFALGVGLGLMTAWMEKTHVGAQGPEWSLTFADRCLIAGRAVWFYAGKLVWPAQLTFIYPRWEIQPEVWWQWLFPIAAIGAVAGLWLARRRMGRGPLVAVLFFVGTLGPALGFVNVYPMRYSFVADHFQYLAAVGLITLGAAGLARLPRLIPATLVALLAALTWQQTGIYRNLDILWRDTLAKNPDCWLAHNNLGIYLYNEGRMEEAMDHYQKAIRINPNRFDTFYNLGAALAAEGRFDEAIANYHLALQINPNYAYALNNLGIALANQGRLDEAIPCYRQAIQIEPDFPGALNNLGVALAASGQLDEAIEAFHKSIQINPTSSSTLNNLGHVLAARGRFEEAIENYHQAIQINPDFAEALNNLAWVLAASPDDKLRNGAGAVRLAERACELTRHGQPWFMRTLAAAYAEAGRFPEAVAAAEKAEQLAAGAGLTAAAAKNRQLLELFRSGKPYHEPPPPRL